jgi:hypothetical protein
MLLRRVPLRGVAVLLALILVGVALSATIRTRASPVSSSPAAFNHPTIHDTDGQPAISPHSDGSLLTPPDVQRYVSTHRFPAGNVVNGGRLQIEVLQLVTSHQASLYMRGESIGLPDNAEVYYVVVKGPFMTGGLLVPTGSGASTFNLGEEAFDAQTGNLLVWGIRG